MPFDCCDVFFLFLFSFISFIFFGGPWDIDSRLIEGLPVFELRTALCLRRHSQHISEVFLIKGEIILRIRRDNDEEVLLGRKGTKSKQNGSK